MRFKDYDPASGQVTLHKTKNGNEQIVSLPLFVNEALKRLGEGRPDARLFGYTQRFALNNMLKRACRRAGVEYFSPHKVGRHSFSAGS